MQWYYAVNGQRQGPVSQSEFDRLVAEGTINSATLVWRQGMAEWQPYSSIAGPAAVPAMATAGGGGEEETQVCAVSGKRYPVREMIQYDGKWISAEHRDEYFQRVREGLGASGSDVVPGPFGYGGFWRRAGAVMLDTIILSVGNMAIGMFVGLLFIGVIRHNPKMMLAVQGFNMVLGIGVAIGYYVLFIRKFDATPGKMALGLKLLRTDGSKLSVGRVIGRYFAYILSSLILCIGYIMAGVDDEKRALHDRIVDTRVIKTRQ